MYADQICFRALLLLCTDRRLRDQSKSKLNILYFQVWQNVRKMEGKKLAQIMNELE